MESAVRRVCLITKSPAETMRAGQMLAEALGNGRTVWIALDGALGAGKTEFVRGLASGFGYDGLVTSPTYAIVHEYRNAAGVLRLLHLDICRLSAEDLDDAEWAEYGELRVPIAVEWAKNAPDWVQDAVHVCIEGSGDAPRRIAITAPEQFALPPAWRAG